MHSMVGQFFDIETRKHEVEIFVDASPSEMGVPWENRAFVAPRKGPGSSNCICGNV